MNRSALVALSGLLALACAKPSPWTKVPDSHSQGDGTIAGEPALVHRFAAAPTIDGHLDDAVWQAATTLGPLVDPGQGEPDRSPLAGSYARIGYDDRALYLAFFVPDASPSSNSGRLETDPHLWEQASAVELMLQPGDPGDNRDYYEMQFDINGAVFDTHWDDYNTPIVEGPAGKIFGHQDWSCQAERASLVERAGYSIEIAVPWKAFVAGRAAIPPKSGDVWRLNLYAFRDGQRIANAWSPIRRQGNFHKSSRFGRVKFE
jgi:hypothetical protein